MNTNQNTWVVPQKITCKESMSVIVGVDGKSIIAKGRCHGSPSWVSIIPKFTPSPVNGGDGKMRNIYKKNVMK